MGVVAQTTATGDHRNRRREFDEGPVQRKRTRPASGDQIDVQFFAGFGRQHDAGRVGTSAEPLHDTDGVGAGKEAGLHHHDRAAAHRSTQGVDRFGDDDVERRKLTEGCGKSGREHRGFGGEDNPDRIRRRRDSGFESGGHDHRDRPRAFA